MKKYLSSEYIKEKWKHEGFQKYFRNTGWMFFGRFFSLGVSFFVGAYIARYLGPTNYGTLNYVISFVGLFGFLASFGIDGIVGREIIKNHNLKDTIIGTSFYLKLIGAISTIILTIAVAYFTTSNIFIFLLIILFSLNYIPQSFNIIEIYFQSQVLSKNVVRAQISATLISTLLKILVIFLNKGIFWLMLIYIIESTLFALFLLFAFKHHGHHFRNWKFNKKIAISTLKDSWPLMLSSLAIGIYMKIDQVMIKHMLGDEQVGIYAVAVKLSEMWYFIPMMICSSVFPAITRAKEKGELFLEKRMKKLYFFMFWFSLIIASSTTILSHFIVTTLFGNEYLDSVTVLNIYIWSQIATFIGVSISQFLLVNNLTRISLYNTFLGAFINIILNVLLIPIYGVNGAAIATLISYLTATFGVFLYKDSRSQGMVFLSSIFNLK